MCIFRFSRVFFRPFKFYTIFAADVYSCNHKNDSNTVLNHRMSATLLYSNRGLTYTSCLAYSAARILRAGGRTRNALLQRRFWSALIRNSFRVGPDVASRIKCKYNCARISRLYLASDFLTTPPPRIARHCDPLRLGMFAPRRLRSLQPGDVCSPHLMMYISSTKIFNSATQAGSSVLPRFRADFVAKIQHVMCSECAIVAIPSYTDRATVIQLLTHSVRHALSDSIFTSPIPMVT